MIDDDGGDDNDDDDDDDDDGDGDGDGDDDDGISAVRMVSGILTPVYLI
jgi:hypothetical protein